MSTARKSPGGFGRGQFRAPIAESLLHATPARYVGEERPAEARTRRSPAASLVDRMPKTRARKAQPGKPAGRKSADDQTSIDYIREKLLPPVLEQVDMQAASRLDRSELVDALDPVIRGVCAGMQLTLNAGEQTALHRALIDEIVGFGPLEPLLADPGVADILVNGPDRVYVERAGKLELSDVTFHDDRHVLQVANKICNRVGRRIDISCPIADARLPDGSRVNVIGPPLALRGTSISIRKFGQHKMELDDLVDRRALSPEMAAFLKIATLARLNIVISGGTGSGKTTMLNALSQFIHPAERIVTIEDAAELQLRQPHVVPLETRPPNIEGKGQITIRDLLINALRMRPDRIILGEVRGPECFEMLQAFNTGHDGGMCTLHANSPRDALTRMENLLVMANPNYPVTAMRKQIAETVDLIVQVKRMRDGVRRVTDIVEVVGMENEVVTTQKLYSFVHSGDDNRGDVVGRFDYGGFRPHCETRIREAGLAGPLREALR